MKSLKEYKKEIEQDPKARRRLKKLEKEFEQVEQSLTDEELIKYGLRPAEQNTPETGSVPADPENNKTPASDKAGAVDSVIDVISRKI